MCARAYRMGRRREAADATRARVLAAARKLLTAKGGAAGFSMDAVAHKAGVARMTIYYQFRSKAGLLEALFDDVAARGGIATVGGAFVLADPLAGLAELVAVFGRFWSAERLIVRRLRAWAALDPVFERALRSRDERRRRGLRALAGRIADHYGRPEPGADDETVDLLHALTSFESFDQLAGPDRSPEDVTPLVLRFVHAVLGLDARAGSAKNPQPAGGPRSRPPPESCRGGAG
jgi:AcrR family transcriptional regulator